LLVNETGVASIHGTADAARRRLRPGCLPRGGG